jgi:succinoglycan biosynthesis protein ExoM
LGLPASPTAQQLLEMTGPAGKTHGGEPFIDVCICTYRRESLANTLDSLSRQSGLSQRFRVIVADNDESPTAAARVEAGRTAGLEIVYVHAPKKNISVARNACLDAATAPFIAWIDDDERAAEDWLSCLTAAVVESGADAAFGIVEAEYPETAPDWAVEADLHSTRAVVTSKGVDTGYTSNAIVRRSAAEGLRFDLRLGRSGGEDTDYFSRLHLQGGRLVAAPLAVVREPVGAERLRLGWLLRRAFRSGQTHARRFLASPGARMAAFPVASAKVLACTGLALVSFRSAAGWRRAVVRAGLHAGAAARLLGVREQRLY